MPERCERDTALSQTGKIIAEDLKYDHHHSSLWNLVNPTTSLLLLESPNILSTVVGVTENDGHPQGYF